MFYSVIVETEETVDTHNFYGYKEAVVFCVECASCSNVNHTYVINSKTGELMLQFLNGKVTWFERVDD